VINAVPLEERAMFNFLHDEANQSPGVSSYKLTRLRLK
jgi:hypothetical protein